MEKGDEINCCNADKVIKKPASVTKSTNLRHALKEIQGLTKKKLDGKSLLKDTLKLKVTPESRSLLWRLYLNILPIDNPDNWQNLLCASRRVYYNSHDSHINPDIMNFLRSEMSKEDFVAKYNQTLMENVNVIKLDVERTFQEFELFRTDKIKAILFKVLYIWSIHHQSTGYCQGMNEIAGTLLYAFHPAYVAATSIDVMEKDTKDEAFIYHLVNYEEHMEADLFQVYSELMDRQLIDLYDYNEKHKVNYNDNFDTIDKKTMLIEDIMREDCTVLKRRINKIFYYYLKVLDKELFLHVCDKVEPYLFLFRWILCVFTREFSVTNAVFVWDYILAIEYEERLDTQTCPVMSDNLNLADFICVAMLSDMRDQLLKKADNYYLLRLMMHFPNDKNFKAILKRALKMKQKMIDHLAKKKPAN